MFDELKSLEPKGTGIILSEESIQGQFDVYNAVINRVKQLYMVEYDSDLIEVSTTNCCCSECAKYIGRIYTLTGMDTRFPLFPEWLIKTKCAHCLGISIFPFIYDSHTPTYVEGDAIETSNKPFVDNRPQEHIDAYNRIISEYEEEMRDRGIYPLLVEKCPNTAPKTYGAYRRMKKQKSKGYLKLVEAAKAVGIELPL